MSEIYSSAATTKVAVAVRIRPLSENELNGEDVEAGYSQDNCAVECINAIAAQKQIVAGADTLFTFDHVFGSDSTQREIYDQCVDELLNAALEGFNATILAYGQTGSGKTWTMGSSITSPPQSNMTVSDDSAVEEKSIDTCLEDNELDGIIPRVIKNLFQNIYSREQQDSNSTYKIFVQFLEIYGEDIKDLLDGTKTSKVSIRETPAGEVFVSGAREELVTSYEQMMKCLADGTKHRTTAATKMNNTSSRSHAIFTITIEHTIHSLPVHNATVLQPINDELIDEDVSLKQTATETNSTSNPNKGQAEVRKSKFHFVDLAGSERAKRTGAQGNTLKEGIDINKGLLALGNVISALGDDQKRGKVFVPYRDSKLTRMLQDSLGGNSKTLMICCVSPANINYSESVNALRYANRARNIKNKPVLNRDPTLMIIDELKHTLSRVCSELLDIRKAKRFEERADAIPLPQLELWCSLNSTNKGLYSMETLINSTEASNAGQRSSINFGSSSSSVGSFQSNGSRKPAVGNNTNSSVKDRQEIKSLRDQLSASDFEIRRLSEQLSSLRQQVSGNRDELIQSKSELCYYKHKWEETCPEEVSVLAGSADSNIEKIEFMDSTSRFVREIEDLRTQLARERQQKYRSNHLNHGRDDGDSVGTEEGTLMSLDDIAMSARMSFEAENDTSSIEALIAQTREQLELEYNRLKDSQPNLSKSVSSSDKSANQSPDSVTSSVGTGITKSSVEEREGNSNLCELVENALHSTQVEDDAKEHSRRQSILSHEVIELGQSIQLKEQLLQQLEKGQHQYVAMKTFYENKLLLLSVEMQTKEQERDALLHELNIQLQAEHANNHSSDASATKVNKDKEKLLSAQLAKKEEELKALKKRQEELSHLSLVQSRYMQQKTKLENDITEMKRQRVSLTRELQLQKKRYTSSLNDKAREIDKLKRELLKTAGQMKKLSKDKEAAEIRARDAYLSRLALTSAATATSHSRKSSIASSNHHSNSSSNQVNANAASSGTLSAVKAMKKVARLTRNITGISGGSNRIFSSEDLHTKKWLEKRLLSLSQEEAVAEILKKLCHTHMELLNKKSSLEKELESGRNHNKHLQAEYADRIELLEAHITDSEKQINEMESQIPSDGEARLIFYEKTLEVLRRSALSAIAPSTASSQSPAHPQDLVRLLFDMLVSSFKRVQLAGIEEAEAETREKTLKARIDDLNAELMTQRHTYDINLTQLSTDYEQKLEGIFRNINETSLPLLHCTSPASSSPQSSPTANSHSTSHSNLLSHGDRDSASRTNSRCSQTHSHSSTISGSSGGVESVQLSLAVEECNLLRSQLARSAVSNAENASRCAELERSNQRLMREQEEKDLQVRFLEEDRALFKDMVDDLKASLLAMGREGRNIIDTVKDRAAQKKQQHQHKRADSNYSALLDDEEGLEEEDGWDPENTHIILDEYNLISDEIRFGDWPQVSPSNSLNSQSAFTFGRAPAQSQGLGSWQAQATPPSLQQQQLLHGHSHSHSVNGLAQQMQVPVYDRLANPSYYTGHMRNVFDGKNMEQKRKKVQKIKERKVPATPSPAVPGPQLGPGPAAPGALSTSAEWKKPPLVSGADERGAMGGENCSANASNAMSGNSSNSNNSKTPSAKGEHSKRVAAAGLSAQRPQRSLHRANSADWAMVDGPLQTSSSSSSGNHHHSSNSNNNSSRVTPKRSDRRSSVGSISTTSSLTSLPTESHKTVQLEEEDGLDAVGLVGRQDTLMDGTMV